jgi:hypothetical protein
MPADDGMRRNYGTSLSLAAFLLVSSVTVAGCQSEAEPPLSGPAACAAAGGRCIVGPATGCAQVGPQDCNPDRNPGGAICCLDERVADASHEAADASFEAADASSEAADASSEAADAADAGPFCSTSLSTTSFPAKLSDVPFASWCAANPGRVTEWTCGGIVAVTIWVGVDCHEQYFFDPTSRALVAVVQGCNIANGVCIAGNADFAVPQDCLGRIVIDVIDVCAEGGLTTMAPDGAGAPCTDDSHCPTGYRCGYFTNNGCGAAPECFYGDFLNNPTCTHEVRCACDGTVTEGCVGPWGGFTLKPVSTRETGPCTD